MKPVRVLVSGTNYGRTYLDAIRLRNNVYELVGILAFGSARSQKVARQQGVPLYRHVEELPADIDMACAAMGSSASDIVLGLLGRGIHVLCEHPLKTAHLKKALQTAATNEVCFHINGHFADLSAAQAFIRHGQNLRQSAQPAFLQVTATDRYLYAAVDILRRALGTLAPFRFNISNGFSPFTVIEGCLAGVKATFQVQCDAGRGGGVLQDGSPNYLTDYRIAMGFPAGILTLMSIAGPVIWNFNYSSATVPDRPLWTSIYADRAITGQKLRRQRIVANLQSMDALVRNVRTRAVPSEQTPDHLLQVSQVWQALGKNLQDLKESPQRHRDR